MISFIDTHREEHGIEPICEMLPIAPATYYAHKARQRKPELRPARAKRDEELSVEIRRIWKASFDGVYGAEKVWRELLREGVNRRALHGGAVDAGDGPSRRRTGRRVQGCGFRPS